MGTYNDGLSAREALELAGIPNIPTEQAIVDTFKEAVAAINEMAECAQCQSEKEYLIYHQVRKLETPALKGVSMQVDFAKHGVKARRLNDQAVSFQLNGKTYTLAIPKPEHSHQFVGRDLCHACLWELYPPRIEVIEGSAK